MVTIRSVPMVSPTSASTTSGENVCPPLPAAMVCVVGPVEFVEFGVLVASDREALDVTVPELEAEPKEVVSCAMTATARVNKEPTRCIIVTKVVFKRLVRTYGWEKQVVPVITDKKLR